MGLGVSLSWHWDIIDYLEKVDIRIDVVGRVVNVGTITRWFSIRVNRLLRMTRSQIMKRQGFGTHRSWIQSLVRCEMNVVRWH